MFSRLLQLLFRQLERLKLKWRALATPYRLYAIATALAVVGSMRVFLAIEHSWSFDLAISSSAILFGLGFVLWIKPWLQGKWQTSNGKLLLAGMHTAILFLAVIPSRDFVSNALGLPPQDFEITVHIFAVELYPALWLLLVSFALLAVSLILLLLTVLCMMSTQPIINDLLLLASKLLAAQSKMRSFIESGRDQFISRAFGHVMGAIFVSLAAAYVWDLHAKFLIDNSAIIRWAAYATDFHHSKNYPGVDSSKKLRLHENGVVSYAEPDGRGIKITVGRFHE
jgi:hypothetical protein